MERKSLYIVLENTASGEAFYAPNRDLSEWKINHEIRGYVNSYGEAQNVLLSVTGMTRLERLQAGFRDMVTEPNWLDTYVCDEPPGVE